MTSSVLPCSHPQLLFTKLLKSDRSGKHRKMGSVLLQCIGLPVSETNSGWSTIIPRLSECWTKLPAGKQPGHAQLPKPDSHPSSRLPPFPGPFLRPRACWVPSRATERRTTITVALRERAHVVVELQTQKL